jgi:N-acyl-L-homoserine lactone synthetase
MNALEERLARTHIVAEAGKETACANDELVYSQAGIALPRYAHRLPRRAIERALPRERPPTRYSVRTYTARTVARHGSARMALEAAYRLRAHVFAHELGWLTPSEDRREHDRCDPLARHFFGFAHMQQGPAILVGYARVLLPHQVFMLQHEFIELVEGVSEHKESAAGDHLFPPDARRAFEVSRFLVHPSYRGRRCVEGYTVADHLARAITRWALSVGRADWWTVCEARHLRALRLRGLYFSQVGRIVEYQPGVEACAAVLSLPVAAAALRQRHPDLYAWYTRRPGGHV